jgi:hypothetical protein
MLTPAEVLEIAAAVAEREVEMMKYSSWLTASLIGFSKPPPFDQCFPKNRVVRPAGQVDIGAIFARAGHQVVQANDQ